jgi:glycosyltransferase involved in cell wall biosynthesis
VSSNHHLRIAFDTWPLSSHARNTGIYVYAWNLLLQFREIASERGVEIRPYACPTAENDANLAAAALGFQPVLTKLLRFSHLWRYGGAAFATARSDSDVAFSPSCNTLLWRRPVPWAVTVHDVSPLIMPFQSRKMAAMLRFFLKRAIRGSAAVITVSQSSKAEIVEHYQIPPEKISVVYNGLDSVRFNTQIVDADTKKQIAARYGITCPYLMHHGAIHPRKNLERLIQGYDLMLRRTPELECDLVLAGNLAWRYQDVLRLAAAARPRGKVILTGPVSDADLAVLIKGAQLAVMPSLYEGFCLPMVEAMACGTPTIASRASCLPEVSGNALRYFDPTSVEDMADCIQVALTDSSVRKALVEKGIHRAREFSWRRCAEETLAVLVRTAEAEALTGNTPRRSAR